MHFDVTREREVLAERVPDEAVVGQDAAQIRVSLEQDAVEIKRLTLEPVGAVPDIDDLFDDRRIRRARKDAQA